MMHAFRHRWLVLTLLAASTLPLRPARAFDNNSPGDPAHALLKTYCVRCHNPDNHKADVALPTFGARPGSLQGRKVWLKVLEQLQSEEMPPEDPAPTEDERRRLIEWAERGLN